MDHSSTPLHRLAILIDAENVGASCWPAACAIAARFGTAVVVRAYVCHAPPPGWIGVEGVEIVDGRPASGPNAADFLMAMDAAVMAAEGRVDGFVLLTGDDGFAAVAHWLKMRGASVYALIPFHGAPVARRLVAMADLAILVPLPMPKPVNSDLASDEWGHQFQLALAQCKADEEGWVPLHKVGGVLKAAGVKLPAGKLSDLARQLPGVECQGSAASMQVRCMLHGTPRTATAAALMPVFTGAEDEDIPF